MMMIMVMMVVIATFVGTHSIPKPYTKYFNSIVSFNFSPFWQSILLLFPISEMKKLRHRMHK